MIVVLLNCLFAGSSVFAQNRIITGRVTSAGVGISGVSVVVKGSSRAVLTDADGNYKIPVEDQTVTLVFSSVGYTPQEISTNGSQPVNISMLESDRVLSEVVVTALGIRKETKKIGYSIQEVKGAELIKARDPNAFAQLEGKVAGLDIGESSEMYGRPNIVLRGNQDVLIVVDGVPISSDTWNVVSDDIESVNVLKGPNAAALYGFRGQNGAIIITTKRGTHAGKGWQVDFNSSNMLQKGFTVIPKTQTQFGRGSQYEYEYNQPGVMTAYPYAGQTLYDWGQRLAIWGPRMDGQNVVQYNSPYDVATGTWTASPFTTKGAKNLQNFLEAGFLSTNSISMSSTGEKSDIRISYSHIYQKGQGPNTRLNMDNFNISAGYSFSPKLKVEGNVNFNEQYSPNVPDVDYGPNSYVYMFDVYGPASYDVRDLKNYYGGAQGRPGLIQYSENYGRSNNPYFMANQWLRGRYKTDIYGYGKATYNFSPDLSLSLRTAVTTWSQLLTEKVPASAILNTYLSWYYPAWYGDYRQDNRRLFENNTDLLLSYKKQFGDFLLNANVGGSIRSFQYNSSWATTKDLAVPGVYTLSNTQQSGYSYTFNSNMEVYSGYYSADLSYKNYLTLSTTGRVDNLSTLSSGNATFFYPSVSLATSVGDYIHLPASIDQLKLRASFADVKGGLTSAQAGSAFQMLTGKTLNSGLLGYGSEAYTAYDGPNYQNQNTYNITTYYNNQPAVSYSTNIANASAKPFDIKSYEAGLDYSMFKGRLSLNLTYFENLNGPLIYQLPVASSTGYQSRTVNAIESEKKGWEVVFNATPVKTHNFRWDIGINWATYRETLHKTYPGVATVQIGNHNYKIGERLDDFYSTAFVRDGSGNVVWSGGEPLRAPSGINNYKLLGHLDPDFSTGISNRFTYKNWSLSFQFDGRVGGKIYDAVWYDGMNGGTAIASDQGALGVARNAEWESTNKGTAAPTPAYLGKGVMITSGTPTYSGGNITNLKDVAFATNNVKSTVQSYLSGGLSSNFDEYYMISRTFFKLREARLTYNFSDKTLGKNGFFKSAAIAFVGRNLLYFAARKDFDIDQYASGFNMQTQSVTGNSGDGLSSSTSRWLGFNFNLGF